MHQFLIAGGLLGLETYEAKTAADLTKWEVFARILTYMNLWNSFITISRCKYSESFFWQGQIIQFYFEAEKKQFLWLVTKVLITLRWHSNKSETVSNYCISYSLAPQPENTIMSTMRWFWVWKNVWILAAGQWTFILWRCFELPLQTAEQQFGIRVAVLKRFRSTFC